MKTTSTPFAIGDPFAKDQPRKPAGESALDPTVRVAQQGAGIQRVKKANAPTPKPCKTWYKGDFVRGDTVFVEDRKTTISGVVKHVYEDNHLLLLEGGMLVNRRYVVRVIHPVRALAVIEKPQRPAVNVLPKGETPIPLLARNWRGLDWYNAYKLRDQLQALEYDALQWVKRAGLYDSGGHSNYGAQCTALAMASNEIGYRYQFRGHAGYKNAYAYR